ncbi:hypothetical protein CsSME_00007633 [Camellia sinensis var. sinensis]
MTRRCSHCANDGHNSRTCPSRAGVKLFGVRLTDGGSIIKKSASMGNLSAHYHSSSSAAASPNPSSPSLDPIHDPLHLPDGYLSDDPAHATSSSNRRAQRKKGTSLFCFYSNRIESYHFFFCFLFQTRFFLADN